MISPTPATSEHPLELHLRRLSSGSPVWVVAVHVSTVAGIDDAPLRTTRMVYCSPVPFDEHWCGTTGLRGGTDAGGRIPSAFRAEIASWIDDEIQTGSHSDLNGV